LNWGDGVAVAEPVHGSAPDIAGQGVANPIAAILSGALLLRHVWGMADVARRVETAVYHTLSQHSLKEWGGPAVITQTILAQL
jgi:isocitrate/isopropylmalate dehydrogenase